MIVGALIFLSILTSQCVRPHNKVITINSNDGRDNTKCCVKGKCLCSSLSTTLLNIDSNNIINITSESVALNNTTTMGSGKLTNITITGSNVTIMCNNSGSVYCESCDDVRIEGVTWDRCSDPNGTNIAGVTFNVTSNISLVNCTFQHSQIPTVALTEIADNIAIQGCTFLSNELMRVDHNYGVIIITRTMYPSRLLKSSQITITIFEGYFYNNGFLQNNTVSPSKLSSLYINVFDFVAIRNCEVILKKSTFMSNRNNAVFIGVDVIQLIKIQLTEVLVCNNTFYSLFGVHFRLKFTSSKFNGNCSNNVWHSIMGYQSVKIDNSNFTDNQNANSSLLAIAIWPNIQSKVTYYRVQFNNNQGRISVVSNLVIKGDIEINMHMVNFTHNQYLGGALHIFPMDGNNSTILLKKCEFVNNQSPGQGSVLHFITENSFDAYIQIQDTNFNENNGGHSVVEIATTQSDITHNITKIKVIVNTSTFTNNVGSSMILSACDIKLLGNLLFKNNTAENGGAMFLNQRTTVTIADEASVQFIGNTATLNGGAIYVNFLCDNFRQGTDTFLYHTVLTNFSVTFINNSAIISGNSLYFSINRFCSINTNINNYGTLLYVPCHFNYSQPVNDKMMHIPCDLDYTLLNGARAPIVTSP